MKNNKLTSYLTAAVAGLSLSWAANCQAAADIVAFSFDNSTDFDAWVVNPWGGQGADTTWDGTQDSAGGTGSLHLVDDFSAGDQFVNLGWFGASAWPSPEPVPVDLTLYTNVSFDIKWDASYSTIELSTFRTTGETIQFWAIGSSNSWITLGTFNIPDTASNGWVTVNVPINQATAGIDKTIGLGFKKWTGSGPTGVSGMWVDNITLWAAGGAPPPPEMYYSNADRGLNVYALAGGNPPYDRETLRVNPNLGAFQSWVGSGTMTYSFNISQFPTKPENAGYAAYMWLVGGTPGTEDSADWNEPDCIYMQLQCDSNGIASYSFHWKTNAPYGNGEISYYTGYQVTNDQPGYFGGNWPVDWPTVTNPTPVGTWTLTFVSDTQVTMTAPGGDTTNFVLGVTSTNLPDITPSFADVTMYVGVQPNNLESIGAKTIFGGAALSGAGASTVTNNWLTETTFDTANWEFLGMSAQNNLYVGEANSRLVTWTVPDAGFALQTNSVLADPAWSTNGVPGNKQIGALKYTIIAPSTFPAQDQLFYRLSKPGF